MIARKVHETENKVVLGRKFNRKSYFLLLFTFNIVVEDIESHY
jgi:hypothetical protein